ncbi:MAG: S8 family peptidase, partial [Planctomycetota bacterium]
MFSSVPWAEVCEVGVESAEEYTGDSPDVMKWDPSSNSHDRDTLFSTPSEQIHDTYGFQGEGQTVAIIDSGIAWDHVALGGGFGEGYQVVGGWDFTEENDADPYDDGPAGFHGTHVAGIIGAESAAHVGVAPGVDLVGLRVFNDQGLGYADWVEQALNWVHEHQNDFRFPITTVNLSLGTAWNGDSPPEWAMLEDQLAQLTQDGILVSAAAGNSFARYDEPGLSYPAASPHVVPVASVGDDGQLSDFSQRHERVLAAPGELITSTVPDHIFGADGNMDDWAAISGTSMAAPYVAGASVLVREAMQFVDDTSMTQSDIHEHLCRTADPIFDASTDSFYHRLNLTQAIESLMPADDYGSSLDTAFDVGLLQAEQTLSGHLARLDDHDVFQFTASANGELEWEAIGDRAFGVTWLSENGEVLEQSEQASIELKAGRTYALKLSAGDHVTHFDVRMSFTPDGLVTVDGNVVRVNGTSDSDTISFWVDDRYRLEVNGERYSYDMDVAWTFELHGGGGDDQLTVSGGAGNDTLSLWAGRARMTGTGYALEADEFSSITVLAGSGVENIAHLFGTDGNDRFVASPSSASLSGSDYSNQIEGFTQVFAYAETGRNDIAWLYDSAGDDEFTARPGDSVLQGPGYFINAVDFNRVYAHASTGSDTAQLFDSNHGDLFVGTPHAGWMQGYG